MPEGYDRWISAAVIALALYGTIMIASASMGISVGDNASLAKTVIKQIIFLGLGFGAMIYLAKHFRISWMRSGWFTLSIVGMIAALAVCRLFTPVNGAYAWIRLPVPGIEITIQPSEFAKILCMMIVAAYCGDITQQYSSGWEILRRPVIFVAIYFLIIVVLQRDFGSAVVMFLITCVCLLIPNNPQLKGYQLTLKVLFWFTVAAALFILSPYGRNVIENLPIEYYQKNRFLSALDPFYDKYGSSFQLISGLVSFTTGGWFGKGLGNSVRKYTNFPEANTDFILAILVEELGFFGFLFLLAFYMVIIVHLLQYAMRIRSERARVILVGIAMYIVIHMFFNIGGVTGLIPLTGVPLLMISAGGSSTLSFMICMGIAQAIISAYRRGAIR